MPEMAGERGAIHERGRETATMLTGRGKKLLIKMGFCLKFHAVGTDAAWAVVGFVLCRLQVLIIIYAVLSPESELTAPSTGTTRAISSEWIAE